MINIHFLQVSVFLIFFNYLKLSKKAKKSNYEKLIQIMLGLTFVSGLLFWNNPVKFNFFHIFDKVNFVILLILLNIYFFFIKKNVSKIKLTISAILLNITTFISYKNRTNSIKWLSQNHLYYQFLLHLFSNLSIYHFLN